mmetsp:Transcript_13484/g.33914  ORF Transcript_13484/g.33914 Transcript_13484/m.33914 type:complete len:330 (-) Transcript_13484:218-1207(-)
MVAVKSPAARSPRLVTHYLLLAFAASFLFGTVFVVHNSHTQSMYIRAHVAKPHLIYGTAWKKGQTATLVSDAVKAGFRHIDTACQPKHYNEPGVGNGWKAAADELGLERKDLWLQTKFTPIGGQDPNNVPYDPTKPIDEQAKESLKRSLKNLQTAYLDSWVLHSSPGDFEDLMKVWRVMEEAVDNKQAKAIGISNIYDPPTFRMLYKQARHKPSFLQNRFTKKTDFDTDLRHFCQSHNIQYQSFWTLTANVRALDTEKVRKLAEGKGLTPQTYMYAFLMSLGYVTPLSGTTDKSHMEEDVAVMAKLQGGEQMFTLDEQKYMAKLLDMHL